MAEIKAMYSNDVNELYNTLFDCWDWIKAEPTNAGGTLWINDKSYISVWEGSYNNYLEFAVGEYELFKGNSNTNYGLYIVKTNSATLIQLQKGNAVPGIANDMIILSSATNHYTGIKENVMSLFQSPKLNDSTDTTIFSYIGSKDVTSNDVAEKTLGFIKGNAKITATTPFFYGKSQTTLDDVHLITSYQPSALYRGDCTINGRRYYVCNLIAVLDE